MAKLSINEAAKRFDVSRPTILKHLKSGYITGNKVTGKGWEIDSSELARVYQARGEIMETDDIDKLPIVAKDLNADLKAENARLKAELEGVQALAEERGKRLDQLIPMLTAPPKRRWWPF